MPSAFQSWIAAVVAAAHGRSSVILVTLGAAALAGSVGGCVVGGNCTYEPRVTGTVAITSIDPPAASAATVAGEACVSVNYAWTTGGPSRFSDFDRFQATPSCLRAQALQVGSTFTVTREDQTSGTCTPSVRTIDSAAVNLCADECSMQRLLHDAGRSDDAPASGDAAASD